MGRRYKRCFELVIFLTNFLGNLVANGVEMDNDLIFFGKTGGFLTGPNDFD